MTDYWTDVYADWEPDEVDPDLEYWPNTAADRSAEQEDEYVEPGPWSEVR